MKKHFVLFSLLIVIAVSFGGRTETAWATEFNAVDLDSLPTNDAIEKTLISACTKQTPTRRGLWVTEIIIDVPPGSVPVKYPSGPAKGYYTCPQAVYNLMQNYSDVNKVSSLTKFYLGTIDVFFYIVNKFSVWALQIASYLMSVMLGQGKFIQNEIVKQAWPFVQGFANLGFIFALLYIALATTLRLESLGTSIQRLIPKLLIGALLVNFSLVIGGLLIDASRVVMAAEIKLLSGGASLDIDNLGDRIIGSSEAYKAAFAALQGSGPGFWQYVLIKFQNALVVVALASGMLIIAINLFVRYIALLVLLIFSPLPYLALALPQTQGIFRQWWKMFLQWVFYGPIALFFLVLIVRIQGVQVFTLSTKQANDNIFFQQLIHLSIIVALLFVGHYVGKKAAGVGSDAVMGFASRNKKTAAAVGLAVATGGMAAPLLAGAGYLAGRAGARGAANVGRDFSDKFKKDFGKRARSGENYAGIPGSGKAAQIIAGAERDDKGKPKKGETSVGMSGAKFISKRFGLGDPRKGKEETAIKTALQPLPAQQLQHAIPSAAAPGGSLIVPPALQAYINGAGLSQEHVTKALGDSNIKILVEHTTDKGHLLGVGQNEDYLRDLGSAGRSELIQRVNNNQNLNPNDKADIVNRIVRTVKDKDL